MEGRIGRGSQGEGTSQTQVPPQWQAFNEWYSQTDLEHRQRALDHGEWPEGTPDIVKDLYPRVTSTEGLKMRIFGDYPPVEEVLARDPENVIRMEQSHQEPHQMLRGQAIDRLAQLTDMERAVLEKRWGMEDGNHKSKRQTAREIGASPRTVGRIEHRALLKLRDPERVARIREQLDESGE